MTAVIGPVGIQHTDLSHGRIAMLLTAEVILNMEEVLKCHGKAQGIIQLLQSSLVQCREAVKDLHILRLGEFHHQCLRLGLVRDPGIHRIHHVILDILLCLIGQFTGYHIGNSGTDDGQRVLIQQADTLLGRICTLVKLARKILGGEYEIALFLRELLFIDDIHRRL